MTRVFDTAEEVIELAQEHGGFIRTHVKKGGDDDHLKVIKVSSRNGGCLLEGCPCTPGLWVSFQGTADSDAEFILVTFTPKLSPGSVDTSFTDKEYDNWASFLDAVDIDVDEIPEVIELP